MAKDKKGFILYADQKDLFEQLTDEKAGQLIKHIFKYVNDENPETDDLIVNLAFTPIKQQLKRDLQKFEEVRKKRSEAGKKSAEARANKAKQDLTNLTSVKSVEQTSTKSTVIDNVNVNDKENDTVINKCFKDEVSFLEWFNKGKFYYTKKEGRNKKLSKTSLNNFKELNKVYTLADFHHALEMMSLNKWVKENNAFNPTHFLVNDNFNRYLNQEKQIDKSRIAATIDFNC